MIQQSPRQLGTGDAGLGMQELDAMSGEPDFPTWTLVSAQTGCRLYWFDRGQRS